MPANVTILVGAPPLKDPKAVARKLAEKERAFKQKEKIKSLKKEIAAMKKFQVTMGACAAACALMSHALSVLLLLVEWLSWQYLRGIDGLLAGCWQISCRTSCSRRR